MKMSRFSEEQIATALWQVDGGTDPRSNPWINEATYSVWRKRYGR